MEWKKKLEAFIKTKKAEKLIIACLAAGLLLVISLPVEADKEAQNAGTAAKESTVGLEEDGVSYEEEMTQVLKEALSKVEGVGEVDVVITFSESEEKVYQTDSQITSEELSEKDSEGGERKSSVKSQESQMVLNGSEPYLIKEVKPKPSGVLVVAQGGGSASVRAEICEAVQALFDIPVHRIKVLKRV